MSNAWEDIGYNHRSRITKKTANRSNLEKFYRLKMIFERLGYVEIKSSSLVSGRFGNDIFDFYLDTDKWYSHSKAEFGSGIIQFCESL